MTWTRRGFLGSLLGAALAAASRFYPSPVPDLFLADIPAVVAPATTVRVMCLRSCYVNSIAQFCSAGNEYDVPLDMPHNRHLRPVVMRHLEEWKPPPDPYLRPPRPRNPDVVAFELDFIRQRAAAWSAGR